MVFEIFLIQESRGTPLLKTFLHIKQQHIHRFFGGTVTYTTSSLRETGICLVAL